MRREIHEVSTSGATWVARDSIEPKEAHIAYCFPHTRTRVLEGDPRLLRRQIAALRLAIGDRLNLTARDEVPVVFLYPICNEFGGSTGIACGRACPNTCPINEDGNWCNAPRSLWRSGTSRQLLDALRGSLRKRERLLADLLGPEAGGEEKEVEMNAEREMLETQVRLLTESINGKWTRLVEDPTNTHSGWRDCPLCSAYHKGRGPVETVCLEKCPLAQDGQCCLLGSSVYHRWDARPCLATALAVRDALVASRAVRVERLRVMDEASEKASALTDACVETRELRVQLAAEVKAGKTSEKMLDEQRARANLMQRVLGAMEEDVRNMATARDEARRERDALQGRLRAIGADVDAEDAKAWDEDAKARAKDRGTLLDEMEQLEDRCTGGAKDLADALRPIWEALRDTARAARGAEAYKSVLIKDTTLAQIISRAVDLVGRGE